MDGAALLRRVAQALPTVHVVFGHSAAAGLREALALVGRNETVACFPDDLGFGPISPPDLAIRAAWVERELGVDDWEDLGGELDAFWRDALGTDVRLVAWFSRRKVSELLAFMAWLDRLGDRPCEVIDLTDVVLADSWRQRPWPLALLRPEEISESALWDRAETLPEADRERMLVAWRRLQREGAPLRVLGPDGLESAPITYFDEQLLGHAARTWRPAAFVVGSVLADQLDDVAFQAGDLVLFSRLPELVAQGRLEARGRPDYRKTYKVRLPTDAARQGTSA